MVQYSLYDGSIVSQIAGMHTNYILQFLLTRDSKKLISCSKDKKIKVWDWIKQECIATFSGHEDSVESIVLNSTEELLFSASGDKKVIMWSISQHFPLCTFTTQFPIRTLTLTDDDTVLLASSRVVEGGSQRDLACWHLEKNEGGYRINVSLKGVSNCYITPDDKYLVTMNGNKQLAIWNTDSRTCVLSAEINA